ncbi:transposase [Wolbachia endosymbiont (group A) of Udea olivalis]|uniref:transposase n=1 Tax=Wolbachia endosymbiont (group A) of Udea olivalis TaxID=3066183 RepID=UPI0031332C20
MQKNGIQAILRRKFKIKKQQTDSSSQYIRPKFIVDQPNKVWDYLYKNQRRMAIFGNNNRSIFTHGS